MSKVCIKFNGDLYHMKKAILAFTFSLISFLGLHAQQTAERDIIVNQIGFAAHTSYSYLHNSAYPALKLRYTRLINPLKVIYVGFEYEHIIRSNVHNTIFIPISLYIHNGFSVNVSPGFSWNNEQPFAYTTQFQMMYQFRFKHLSIGPHATLTLNKVENFVSAGIFMGIPF